MNLYIVRHLETEWNRKGLLQGNRDIDILPPSPAVLAKIEENKQYLKALPTFDHVLVSSLHRTTMTAELYSADITSVEPFLDELDFGPYEGRAKADLQAEQKTWLSDPEKSVLQDNLSALTNRVLNFCLKYENCENVLAFGHGAWIRALLAHNKDGHLKNMNKLEVCNNEVVHVNLN
ncbi:MAG: histidine phosphatase family protein [Desulfotalea sp.]